MVSKRSAVFNSFDFAAFPSGIPSSEPFEGPPAAAFPTGNGPDNPQTVGF
jgi:hypothetical protein